MGSGLVLEILMVLDKVVCSLGWRIKFPHVVVIHHPIANLAHCPIHM